MDYTISAVDRALQLMEVLAENPDIGVTEIANLTGNTKSLVYRLVFTLEKRGYVTKDPLRRTYSVGATTLFLAQAAQQQMNLVRIADPVLDRLAAETGENVLLSVREGIYNVCVALREPARTIRLYAQIGRRGPLHVGGGPKVLLAFAPPDIQREILSGELSVYTSETITDPVKLGAILERIRNQDWNESHGDLDRDAFSFAAPVRDHTGSVIAAVSIAGPASRLTPELSDTYRDLAIAAGTEISNALGWSGLQRKAG